MTAAPRAASGDGRGSTRPRPFRAGARPRRSPPVSPPGGAGRRPGLGSCTGDAEPGRHLAGHRAGTHRRRHHVLSQAAQTQLQVLPPAAAPGKRSRLRGRFGTQPRRGQARLPGTTGAVETCRAPRRPFSGRSPAVPSPALGRDRRDRPELHFFPSFGAGHRPCCDCQMVAALWTPRRAYLSLSCEFLKAAWAVVNMFIVRLSSR